MPWQEFGVIPRLEIAEIRLPIATSKQKRKRKLTASTEAGPSVSGEAGGQTSGPAPKIACRGAVKFTASTRKPSRVDTCLGGSLSTGGAVVIAKSSQQTQALIQDLAEALDDTEVRTSTSEAAVVELEKKLAAADAAKDKALAKMAKDQSAWADAIRQLAGASR